MGWLHLGARHFKSFLVGTLRVVHYAFEEGWNIGNAVITEGKGNQEINMGSGGKDNKDQEHKTQEIGGKKETKR
jgi:hypothetical protein